MKTLWQRFSATGTTPNGLSQLYVQIGGGNFTNGAQVEMWGAQFTQGSVAAPYEAPSGGAGTAIATGQPGTFVPNGLNETYRYDSFGNILQNNSFQPQYNAKNQMIGYSYDAAGNVLSDGINSFTWDAENRIVSVQGVTYLYDGEGDRVETQGSTITDTVYFGGKPVARLSGGQWTDLVYGPTGLLAEIPGTPTGVPAYRALDHLGTMIGTLTPQGIVDPTDYNPSGKLRD